MIYETLSESCSKVEQADNNLIHLNLDPFTTHKPT